MGVYFSEPGRVYKNSLSSDEINLLNIIMKNNKKSEIKEKELSNVYSKGQIFDYINIESLNKEDFMSVCKFLIKSMINTNFINVDNKIILKNMFVKNSLKNLSGNNSENIFFKFALASLLLHFTDNPPSISGLDDAIIHPIHSSLGSSFGSLIAFPLLESICRNLSPILDRDGIILANVSSIRGISINKSINDRASSLYHTLLIYEDSVANNLTSILQELDMDINLYKILRDMRNRQLHGELIRNFNGFLPVFFLIMFYTYYE